LVYRHLLILFIVCSSVGFGHQKDYPSFEPLTVADSLKGKIVDFGYQPLKYMAIGSEYAGYAAKWESNYIRWFRFEPNISWYFYKNLGIGVRGRYEFFRSNFASPKPDLFELGIFARHYLPVYSTRLFLRRFLLFVEVAVSKSNYYYVDKYTTAVVVDDFDQFVLRMPFGFAFNVWKGINIEIAGRYENFIGHYNRFDATLGLSYHFNKK